MKYSTTRDFNKDRRIIQQRISEAHVNVNEVFNQHLPIFNRWKGSVVIMPREGFTISLPLGNKRNKKIITIDFFLEGHGDNIILFDFSYIKDDFSSHKDNQISHIPLGIIYEITEELKKKAEVFKTISKAFYEVTKYKTVFSNVFPSRINFKMKI